MAEAEEPSVKVFPLGVGDEYPDGAPTVVIGHRGAWLVLRFAAGDIHGDGPVQKFSIEPEAEQLEPRVLRRFAPGAEVYVALARSAMRLFDPQGGREGFTSAVEALRKISGPGRGLRDEFYSAIAAHYHLLVEEGEPHPTKAISGAHHVTISAASRWIKEARRRGLILEKEAKSNAR